MRKLKVFFLYLLAIGFLGYHLFPIIGGVAKNVSDRTSTQTTIKSLTESAQCVPSDGAYDRLTYGNPLQDPLYTTLPYKDPTQVPVVGQNILSNPSFADIDPATKQPVAWESNQFGSNKAQFSLDKGPNGSTAAVVNVSQYKDGDAKWSSEQIDVKPGEYYRLETQYKTTAYTYALVDFTFNDGRHDYVILPPVKPTGDNWQTYRTSFVVPSFVELMRVSQVIDQNGQLESTGYKLVKEKLPQFNRGLVSLNFDDGWRSIYDNGLPLFKKYDIKTTQFIISGVLNDKAYMTPKMLDELQTAGNEIGSHTMLHEDLSKLNDQNMQKTIAGSRATLNDFYQYRAVSFAPPYGHYNEAVKKYVEQCYESMRSTETGYNTASYDRYDLKVINIEVNTKPEEIANAVRFARDQKLWVIFVYHEVDSRSDSSYAASLADLEKHLQIFKQEQVPVVTLSQGLAETLPQLR